jgi:adenylate cyclase class 2
MHFEVEQKHRIEDPGAFVAELQAWGVVLGDAVAQSDKYFQHPSRDFAQTDEALRIRTVGKASFVTYKGAKVDATTKTRRELELPLAATDPGGRQFAELLAALGFKPAATVRKQRRPFHVSYRGSDVEGALDDVEGVGHYVELELSADDAGLEAATKTISSLAAELQLGPTERRSYLELLLDQPK